MQDFEKKKARINAEGGFMHHNGIVVTVLREGYCECQVDMDADATNPYSIAHGGLLFSMCDSAAGIAAETRGFEVVTRASAMHFLRPARGGVITAKGRVVQKSSHMAYCETELVDANGELLASASFDMVYLKFPSEA